MEVSGSLQGVRALCESILAGRGAELVEAAMTSEGGRRVLQITVDREDGPPGVDELAAISEEISRALDVEDPIEGRYHLEVMTPGIERPLTRPEHYRRFAGRRVKVRLADVIEGRRSVIGTLASAGEETFVVDMDGEVIEIPYTSVLRTRLEADWDAELKRRPASRGAQ